MSVALLAPNDLAYLARYAANARKYHGYGGQHSYGRAADGIDALLAENAELRRENDNARRLVLVWWQEAERLTAENAELQRLLNVERTKGVEDGR